jgi:2-C-methyl-D-erythritol 4-phosphate cytidylyltransferase
VTTWAIVVAAGRGERYDPVVLKQHEEVRATPIQVLAMRAARSGTAGLVLVTRPEFVDQPHPDADRVVVGGETRSASVRCGLAALPPDCDIVVVHDAARPLATAALFEAVVAQVVAGADAAIPVVAVTDTIKRVEHGQVTQTLERDGLVAVQTPQAFRVEVLRAAHAQAADATDDAALVEALGGRVVVVPGDLGNLKVTTKLDLAVAAALLA